MEEKKGRKTERTETKNKKAVINDVSITVHPPSTRKRIFQRNNVRVMAVPSFCLSLSLFFAPHAVQSVRRRFICMRVTIPRLLPPFFLFSPKLKLHYSPPLSLFLFVSFPSPHLSFSPPMIPFSFVSRSYPVSLRSSVVSPFLPPGPRPPPFIPYATVFPSIFIPPLWPTCFSALNLSPALAPSLNFFTSRAPCLLETSPLPSPVFDRYTFDHTHRDCSVFFSKSLPLGL